MSRFSGDAFFGLDGLGEDEAIQGQAIDLDRDAIKDEQPASSSKSKSKKQSKQPAADGEASAGSPPAGLDPELMRRLQGMGGMPDGVDPAILEQMMRGEMPDLGGGGAEAGGLPDGAGMPPGMGDFDPELMSEMMGVLQGGQRDPAKLRKLMANPQFAAMMEQFGGGMMGGMGGMGGGGPPRRGQGRADAQRERLQERLRKKQEESGGFGPSASGQSTATADADQGGQDDWMVGVPTASSGKARAAKKGGGKKKKGGKKK